jgi:TolA-binding protein
MTSFLNDALAIINSQEQRIKELTEENEVMKRISDERGAEVLRHDKCIRELHNKITELESDNEGLREDNDQWTKMWADNQRQWENAYSKLQAENEMLLNVKNLNIDKVIADTVRKMQERIKQYIDVGHYRSPTEICFSELDVANIIDRIAQEMLEGEK